VKSKDQILLEKAYNAVSKKPALFKDKKDNAIHQGDRVVYNSKQYVIVGAKSILGTGIKKDQIQIEAEDQSLMWVSPKHVLKLT